MQVQLEPVWLDEAAMNYVTIKRPQIKNSRPKTKNQKPDYFFCEDSPNLVFGFWFLVFGSLFLVFGFCFLDIGARDE